MVFAVVRAEALAWRRVERHEEDHRRRAKPAYDSKKENPSSPTKNKDRDDDTCWECGQRGHRKFECPSRKGGSKQPSEGDGDGKKPAVRSQGQQQDSRGEAQSKGTPAARGGSQQKPAAAAGRVALWDGPGWTDLPPQPVPPDQSANGPDGVKIVGGRSVLVSGGTVSSQYDGVQMEPAGLTVDVIGDHGCHVDVSIPGTLRACPVKGVYDSGAGINAVSEKLVREIQAVFPGVRIVESMSQSLLVRAVDGRDVVVTECTCPLRLAIHTINGPHVVGPERLVILPGEDDVLIIGRPMLRKSLGQAARDGGAHGEDIGREGGNHGEDIKRDSERVRGTRRSRER